MSRGPPALPSPCRAAGPGSLCGALELDLEAASRPPGSNSELTLAESKFPPSPPPPPSSFLPSASSSGWEPGSVFPGNDSHVRLPPARPALPVSIQRVRCQQTTAIRGACGAAAAGQAAPAVLPAGEGALPAAPRPGSAETLRTLPGQGRSQPRLRTRTPCPARNRLRCCPARDARGRAGRAGPAGTARRSGTIF